MQSNVEMIKLLVDFKGNMDVKNNYGVEAYTYGHDYIVSDIRAYQKEREALNDSIELNKNSNFTASKDSIALLNTSIENKKKRNYEKPWLIEKNDTSATNLLNQSIVDANKAAEARRRADKRKLVEELEKKRLYLPGYMPETHFGFS